MNIRSLTRDAMVLENGAYGERLVPWPVLNAPFEGAWVLVKPGAETGAHSHHEYEIFIAMKGSAEVESDGERHPITAGDIAHFVPGTVHRVINANPEEFEFYAIWWDPEMSRRFIDTHEDMHHAAAEV